MRYCGNCGAEQPHALYLSVTDRYMIVSGLQLVLNACGDEAYTRERVLRSALAAGIGPVPVGLIAERLGVERAA